MKDYIIWARTYFLQFVIYFLFEDDAMKANFLL